MQTGHVPAGPGHGDLRLPHRPPGPGPDARLDGPKRGAAELHSGPVRGPRAGHDPHAGRGRALSATGIVGVRLEEKSHMWGSHTIEFLSLGTAVVKTTDDGHPARSRPPSFRWTTDVDRRLPPEAASRLERAAFSSGLTVPDFAACLQHGHAAGRAGAGLLRHEVVVVLGGLALPERRRTGRAAAGVAPQQLRCPHGYVRHGDHRSWGRTSSSPG